MSRTRTSVSPVNSAIGDLLDEAARLTPAGFDFAIQWSARDVISDRAEWIAGWYPTFRAHLDPDEAIDAAVIARGAFANEALANLLELKWRLPR